MDADYVKDYNDQDGHLPDTGVKAVSLMAERDPDSEDAERMAEATDQAHYRASYQGCNRVCGERFS